MPLRAPSELSDSLLIYIFVFSFDDGLDEDDDVPSLSLLILRMFACC